jgi:hypothetical protein
VSIANLGADRLAAKSYKQKVKKFWADLGLGRREGGFMSWNGIADQSDQACQGAGWSWLQD